MMKMRILLVTFGLALAAPARATVATTSSSAGPYACDGITVAFPVPFPFLASSDLAVTRSAGGALTRGPDYTVTGSGGQSGTVTLTAGSKCASGTLTISRVMAITQPTTLSAQGPFSPKAIENGLDRATMIAQQLAATRAADLATQAARDSGQDAALESEAAAVRADAAADLAAAQATQATRDSGQDAAIASEATARADGDATLAAAQETQATRDSGQDAAIASEATARADADAILAAAQAAAAPANANTSHSSGWINIQEPPYGVKCDGTNEQSALGSAISAANALNTTLLIPCAVKIDGSAGNLTAPAQFTGPGKIVLASHASITISGALEAPLTKIFDNSGGGQLAFSAKIVAVYPQWWGAKCDGVTDDLASLQTMISSLGSTPATVAVTGPCKTTGACFLPGTAPVRFEANGAFTGTGTVTYARWTLPLLAPLASPTFTGTVTAPTITTTTPGSSLAAGAWIAPTLLNGWANYAGFAPTGYFKDAAGIVHLRGTIRSGTLDAKIFVLPAGYQPIYGTNFVVPANDLFGMVTVDAYGVWSTNVGSQVYMDLGGISFRAEQ